jgi:iron-sulfur cluster assembly accessory protein
MSDITFSPKALVEAQRLLAEKPEWRGLPLRVYLDGKGCDGFTYGVAFDEARGDDVAWSQDGVAIVIDPQSLKFMRGSQVDWVDDERGQGFLVENPMHKRFRGKFYKKSDWEKRLLT